MQIEFAELEEFMDQKLKNYSSGMQVRLAFSVAIQAKGDILVLDEVLAVGDEAFQRKCDNYFAKVKKDPTKTVILVTHDMGAVKKYCKAAKRFDSQSFQRKICGCTAFNAKLYDGAFSGAYFSF